jgi:four helix bundle protein
MSLIRNFRELHVYQNAMDLTMRVFELTKKFPAEERFNLTDQIRRSSRSVCTNLAEAWRKRRYEAAFVSKLSDSDGEAAETEVHLAFALRCGYLPPDKHGALMDQYDHICRQLRKMMDDAPSWCGTGGELREMPAEYFVEASERDSVERQPTLRCSVAPRSVAPDVPRPKRDDSHL